MKKKILSFFVILALISSCLFSFSACGNQNSSIDGWLDYFKVALSSLGDKVEADELPNLEQKEPTEHCPFINKDDLSALQLTKIEYARERELLRDAYVSSFKMESKIGIIFATAKSLGSEYSFGKTLKMVMGADFIKIKSIKQVNHLYSYILDESSTQSTGYGYFDFYFRNVHDFYVTMYTFHFDYLGESTSFVLDEFIYADSNLDLLIKHKDENLRYICEEYSEKYEDLGNVEETIKIYLDSFTSEKRLKEDVNQLGTDVSMEVSLGDVIAKTQEIFPELFSPDGESTGSDIGAINEWLDNFKGALSSLGDNVEVADLKDLEQNEPTEICPVISKAGLSALRTTEVEDNKDLRDGIMTEIKMGQGMIFASAKALNNDYYFGKTFKLTYPYKLTGTYIKSISQENHLYSYAFDKESRESEESSAFYGYFDFYFKNVHDFYLMTYVFHFDDLQNFVLDNFIYADSNLDSLKLRYNDLMYICEGYSKKYEDPDEGEDDILTLLVRCNILTSLKTYTSKNNIKNYIDRLKTNVYMEIPWKNKKTKMDEIFPGLKAPEWPGSDIYAMNEWLNNFKVALVSLGDNTEVGELKDLEQNEPSETCSIISKSELLGGFSADQFTKLKHNKDKKYLKNEFVFLLELQPVWIFASAKVLGDEYNFGKTLKMSGNSASEIVTDYMKTIKQGNHIYSYILDELSTQSGGPFMQPDEPSTQPGGPFMQPDEPSTQPGESYTQLTTMYWYSDFYFKNAHDFYMMVYRFNFDKLDKFWLQSFVYVDSNLDLLMAFSYYDDSSVTYVCNAYSKEYEERNKEDGLLKSICDSLETYTQEIKENFDQLETDVSVEVSMNDTMTEMDEIFPKIKAPEGRGPDIYGMNEWLYNFKATLVSLGDNVEVNKLKDLDRNEPREVCPLIDKFDLVDKISSLGELPGVGDSSSTERDNAMEELKIGQGIEIIFASAEALHEEYYFNETSKLSAEDGVSKTEYIKSIGEGNHLYAYLLFLDGSSNKEYGYFDFYFENDYVENKIYFYITMYKFSFNESNNFVLENFIYADSNLDLLIKSGESGCKYICNGYSEMYEDPSDGEHKLEKAILDSLKTYTSKNNIKEHDDELEANVSTEMFLNDVYGELDEMFTEPEETQLPNEEGE